MGHRDVRVHCAVIVHQGLGVGDDVGLLDLHLDAVAQPAAEVVQSFSQVYLRVHSLEGLCPS